MFESLECIADNTFDQRDFIVSQRLELMLAAVLGQRAFVLANERDQVLRKTIRHLGAEFEVPPLGESTQKQGS